MVCIYIPAIVVVVDAKLEVVEVNMRELEVAEVEKVSKRLVVVLIIVLEGKLVEVVVGNAVLWLIQGWLGDSHV